jgi:RNA polymerase sigma-70 factor, ECF subfamily
VRTDTDVGTGADTDTDTDTDTDWMAVVERLLAEDVAAFLALARLVNGYLARWRAYDFADEWDDLIQEAVLATVAAVRSGRLRDPAAVSGYVRVVTRNKLADRLRARLRLGRNALLPWDERIAAGALDPEGLSRELRADVVAALAELPEKKRLAVCAVYLEGKTYDQVSSEAGIPLGTLKRYLRDGLAQLKDRLQGSLDGG